MASRTAVAALALLALAACAHAQVLDTRVTTDGSNSTQNINKFVPQTTLYTSNAAADFGVTPATPVAGRKLLAGYSTAPVVNAGFTALVAFTAKNNPKFTFVGESKEQFVTEIAEVDYIFGPASMPFLQTIVKGGAGVTFKQAIIYTPQEANAVPFVSTTGFLNSDGSTFTAHIATNNHTTFVPNVAVRFDFALTGTSTAGAAVSPAVSLYYTDRTSDATLTTAVKTTTVNLAVAQGVYIDQKGNVFPGQGPTGR